MKVSLLRACMLLLCVAISALGVACASGSSAPAASKSPAESAKPATSSSAASPAAKPSASAEASAKPAASSDWKAEWDKTLAAAKKEGKVTVVGSAGDLYRNFAMTFQKAYPDIQLEYNGMRGSDFAPKVLAERDGGQYLWDVHFGGAQTGLMTLKPKGVLDPLKPALLLPETLDYSKWFGGQASVWNDKEQQSIFAFHADLQYTFYVNREFVPEAELKTIDQLLDPKWKGKIATNDLRKAGAQNGTMQWILKVRGEDWLRKFYSQDLVIMADERSQVESVIRGRYPIMVAVNPAVLGPFRAEGLAKNVLPLDPDSDLGVAVSGAAGHAMLINKAPHPNAAKVFANWLLTRDGQQAYTKETDLNSRRLDVEGGDPFFKPKPGKAYGELDMEDMVVYSDKAITIAKEYFK